MKAFFGGPDKPARALRDLLEERVEAVPAGGSIDWMTYYFRDQALAGALVRAHERGVQVRVRLEGKPRHRGANDAVIAKLRGRLRDGLQVEHRLFGASHLHTKLYCFGGERPHALVGSFNPSGHEPDDPAMIADIGDQDRGHNLLIEIEDPALVGAFVRHAREGQRLDGREAYSFPRRDDPLGQRLESLGRGAGLRIAASHVRDPSVARQLIAIMQRGGTVELLTHHTLRRSPEGMIKALRDGGVQTFRYHHPDELPMHAKFMLAQDGDQRWSTFGSYNLTRTSRWLNRELLMFSDDADLWRQLDEHWGQITSEPWCAQ